MTAGEPYSLTDLVRAHAEELRQEHVRRKSTPYVPLTEFEALRTTLWNHGYTAPGLVSEILNGNRERTD